MLNAKNKLMKTLIVSGMATVFTLSAGSAMAQESSDRGQRGAAAFERLDANDDSVLTLDELLTPALAKAEKRFERKDADDDGFLTFEEMVGDREPQDLSVYADDIVQCVADVKADTGNEDIVVPDASKFISAQDKFDNTDTSGDGTLELAEVQAMKTTKVTAGFNEMDANDDSQVTEEEFTAHKAKKKATRRAVKSCIEEVTAE